VVWVDCNINLHSGTSNLIDTEVIKYIKVTRDTDLEVLMQCLQSPSAVVVYTFPTPTNAAS